MKPRNLRSNLRTVGAALTLVVFAVTAACGDEDDGEPLAASPTTDRAVTEPPPEGDRDAAVLEVADLPSGWQETPAETLGNDRAGSCLDVLLGGGAPFDPADRRTSAHAFAQSALGAFLMAASTEPVDDGADMLAHIEQLILSCDGETDAQGFTTSITPLPAPEAGDGGVAFRGRAENDQGARISFLLASARAGDAVVLAMNVVALGELDEQLVDDALHAMVERVG